MMENRKPFNLKKILYVYNLIQVFCSAYIAIGLLPSFFRHNLQCEPIDYSNNPNAVKIIHMWWFYYLLKYVDLLDTVSIEY